MMRLLAVVVVLVVALGAGAPAAEGAGQRPPRRVVMSCAAAGYPAGWGSGCTVYRWVSGSGARLPRVIAR